MREFIQLASKLKFLGLLGLPIFFSDAVIWKYFWLFWLFGLVELFAGILTLHHQLLQIVGLLYVALKRLLPNSNRDVDTTLHYSLPFDGVWLAVNGGVDRALSHSWMLYSQRYAYDFFIVDEEVKTFSYDRKCLDHYYCYGRDILAPADGVVVSLSDRCSDSKIMKNAEPDPLIKDFRGNYIFIKHGEDEYSFLAHLKPGSIIVKEGDQVKRFQKLAQCGNSGNTTEPHLHFQVQNRPDVLFSESKRIRFIDVKTEKQDDYEKVDPRKLVVDENIYGNPEYIHRGLAVRNETDV